MPLRRCLDEDPNFPASDPAALCARVIGVDEGSYLASREEPYYGSAEVGQHYNGELVEVDCWTTGDPDADGNGYIYWAGLYAASGPVYVNDWYLDSGGNEEWTPQVSPCP